MRYVFDGLIHGRKIIFEIPYKEKLLNSISIWCHYVDFCIQIVWNENIKAWKNFPYDAFELL